MNGTHVHLKLKYTINVEIQILGHVIQKIDPDLKFILVFFSWAIRMMISNKEEGMEQDVLVFIYQILKRL